MIQTNPTLIAYTLRHCAHQYLYLSLSLTKIPASQGTYHYVAFQHQHQLAEAMLDSCDLDKCCVFSTATVYL